MLKIIYYSSENRLVRGYMKLLPVFDVNNDGILDIFSGEFWY
jgi:hypothetical protein